MTKGISMMRITTQNAPLLGEEEDESDLKDGEIHHHQTIKERIIARRGAFKWLPVLCSTDVAHGSWYLYN
jgi:hypothetical protein